MSGRLKFTLFQTTAAAGTAVVATTFPTFTALLKGCVDAAISALPGLATMTPATSAAPAAAAAASAAQVDAIVRALQRSQPSGGRSLAVLLAGTAAAGLAARHFGWRNFGWATSAQLDAGLGALEASVTAAVAAARAAITAKLGGVERRLESGEAATAGVGHAVGALDEKIAAGFGAVHARVAGVEANAERSARGVELLCEVLASSLAAAPASPHHGDVADRLRAYAAASAPAGHAAAAAPPAVAPISRPELPSPRSSVLAALVAAQ
jgi:hypothetical protein